MMKEHSVKFRTGRGPNDSEARSSAGIPHCDGDVAELYQLRHWDADSLHEKLGLPTSGLAKLDGDLEIHDLVTDVDHMLEDIGLCYITSQAME